MFCTLDRAYNLLFKRFANRKLQSRNPFLSIIEEFFGIVTLTVLLSSASYTSLNQNKAQNTLTTVLRKVTWVKIYYLHFVRTNKYRTDE